MQDPNLKFAIDYLLDVNNLDRSNVIYDFNTFRALMNITMPSNLSADYYKAEDNVLQMSYKDKTIVDVDTLTPIKRNLCLWKGDITLLKADAIVNACNSELLGCFQPLHSCIDNAIHSFAGLEVRRDLMKVMKVQGHREPNGRAKITKGYNLPAKYIIHTVGPIVNGRVTKENETDLYNCYKSSLELAEQNGLKNIVFCSISTGLYGYPIEKAAEVAIKSVCDYFGKTNRGIQKVVFDVFKEADYDIYHRVITAAS